MKRAYDILLCALSVLVLAWFLPWLGNLAFPHAVSDPFVSYSPINEQIVVTDNTGDTQQIFTIDTLGARIPLTKEERDSLLPQLYYTQLMARQAMPDSLQGVEMSVANLRQNQWVFTSTPRDVNQPQPRLFPIMESLPARFELEDPKAVFRLNGKVEFIDMASGNTLTKRSRKFTDAFAKNGFAYPVKSLSANITSRKAYDEGYLMVDNKGNIFHVKMRAGQPYMAKVLLPDSALAEHVFIMENPDQRLIGLATDTNHNLYAIEREGYKAVKLPVGEANARTDRVTIIKDAFNWVVKISDKRGARWIAIDSDVYTQKADYQTNYPSSLWDEISTYIFPFTFSVTNPDDCYVRPRFADFSWRALALNALLTLIVAFALRRGPRWRLAICTVATLVFGLFFTIPLFLFRPFKP